MPKTKNPHPITVEEAKRDRAALNIDEFSSLTGYSRHAAYKRTKSGDIPSVRIAGRVLIPRSVWMPLIGGEV